MNFLLTYDLLENLIDESSDKKRYKVSYYESGIKKSFTVMATSKEEAKSIAWSKVDADSIYVELDESINDPNQLSESTQIISDPDSLFHYTDTLALFNIFDDNALRADVHGKGVCFTTDRDYTIYGYPCGIRVSRKKLEAAGYELEHYDEFPDQPGRGESEERVYNTITNLTDYVTFVYIDWSNIALIPSSSGWRVIGAKYDDLPSEIPETDDFSMYIEDFTDLLQWLRNKGIKVSEIGEPYYDRRHYLEDDGTIIYGDEAYQKSLETA
jgi:hypothetical protein